MYAAGNLKIGVKFFQCLGRVGQYNERFAPAEEFNIVRHVLRHRIAVIIFEALAANWAVARPVVGDAAGNRRDALGESVMRLVPEKAIGLTFARKRHAKVLEVIAVAIGVKASVRKLLAGQSRNLTILDIVLKKLRDLLAAEVFAVAPRVDKNAKPKFMRLGDDGGDVGAPEIEIEFGDCENNLRHSVRLHLLKVRLGVFDIIKTVITD